MQATDNSIIVQETISHFQKMKGKKGNMILKINLEKAFDRIEWSFIWNTVIYFSFPHNFIKNYVLYHHEHYSHSS